MEYLPLETTDDVLLDISAGIVAVSDKKIVITNSRQGDVFIFNRQGKVISHFNHKGQSGEEYPNMRIAVYDEKAMEILIYTYFNKLLVYSEDGKFKRSLSLPDKTSLAKLSNFDDETLLGYDEDGLYGTDYRTKPYLFISKRDGSVVAELDLNLPKRYSNKSLIETTTDKGEKAKTIFMLGITNDWSNGDKFVISDVSADTVYMLTRDKKLTPLLVRTPSVHDDNIKTFFTTLMKTDRFIIMEKCAVDFEKIKSGEQIQSSNLMYSFADGQIFELQPFSADCPDCRYFFGDAEIAENTVAFLLNVNRILDQKEKGTLKGELEQIAETLDAEDNPVLMIAKFGKIEN
jgi:hypothetical protein